MMRRLLAPAAALAIAIGGLATAGLIAAHRALEEKSAALEARLARYRLAARERGASERLLAERRSLDASAPYYLAASSASLASAELQGRVKRAAEEAGGEVLSAEPLPPQKDERETGVRVRLRGDVGTLQRALFALEGSLPLLFVKGLALDAVAQPGVLLVTLDVAAFAARGAGRTPARAEPARVPGFPPLAQFEPVVARGLFGRERPRALGQPAAQRAPSGAGEEELILSGVLIRADRRLALLRVNDSAALLRVEPGERVGRWRVSEVRADRVVLMSGALRRELELAPR